MKNKLPVLLITLLILTPSVGLSQTACVTFNSTDVFFNAASNQIIYTESGISFRFIDGFNGPPFSDVTIGPLNAWSGIYGNDNFSGSKMQWAYAKTNVLFDGLPNDFKTITFDYNSYGEKIIMEDIQVWSQGNYNLTFDTTSLVNGGIVTITGYVDSIGIGASTHNDYVVDNICVETNSAGLYEGTSSLFSIFPNPACNEININSNNSIIGRRFSVYNHIGKVILTGKIDLFSERIFLTGILDGLYIFEIEGYGNCSFVISKD